MKRKKRPPKQKKAPSKLGKGKKKKKRKLTKKETIDLVARLKKGKEKAKKIRRTRTQIERTLQRSGLPQRRLYPYTPRPGYPTQYYEQEHYPNYPLYSDYPTTEQPSTPYYPGAGVSYQGLLRYLQRTIANGSHMRIK